ncbi:MAG: ATP-dependent sacrificial sulfur transferase LarE [Lachnospiraceae bacterium]|nr:ATP-dependent sacrificial sulfur transferase LarE [Lachnospiraceae bacterium]
MTLEDKHRKLKEYILSLGSVAVAYSAGVDSTFLLKTAHEVLGEHCVAFTAVSSLFAKEELEEAVEFCKKEGIKHYCISLDLLKEECFHTNPSNRCYYCKHKIFGAMMEKAKEEGIGFILEGSNLDDLGDYRPGRRAIEELEIKSPMLEVSLTKKDIRELSKKLGLPTATKQSAACLASRIPYGQEITKEKLVLIEQGERVLKNLGFTYYRVRLHGNLARIEVKACDIERLAKKEIREKVTTEFRKIGFSYVSLDLEGYRMGSLNEVL